MIRKLNHKKIAILLCSGFEESEMTKPRQALQKAGATVHLISPESQVKGWRHSHWTKKFKVDINLEQADPKSYDALVLPGGVINPDKLRTYKTAIKFIKYFFKNKKPIAAICHGPLSLIETNQLKKRKLTSYHSIKTDLKNAGAIWKNAQVIVDNGLITSRQPKDIPAFNKALVQEISKSKQSKKPKRHS